MLRYVASPGVCRTGEKSFFVSRRGVQGLRGVRGNGAPVAPPAPWRSRRHRRDRAAGHPGDQRTEGGTQGPPGVAATVNFAEYYALMPSDNPGPVAPGDDIEFPEDGPNQGTITRASSTTFVLADIGTYRVAFGMTIDERAQLQLTVNNVGIPYATFGGGASAHVSGETFITTSVVNSSVTVRNVGFYFLPLTQNAGGSTPITAYLTIQQIG